MLNAGLKRVLILRAFSWSVRGTVLKKILSEQSLCHPFHLNSVSMGDAVMSIFRASKKSEKAPKSFQPKAANRGGEESIISLLPREYRRSLVFRSYMNFT